MSLYHFFSDLLQPFTVCWMLLLAGLFVAWRRSETPRRSLRWLAAAFVLFTVLCLPVVSHFAIGSLEWQYPPSEIDAPADAPIVVLSGWAFRPDEFREEALLGIDSQFRCLHAARLYRQLGSRKLIVAGGKVLPEDVGPSLAALMKDYLIEHGVSAEDILLEEASRNTHENAVNTSAILRERGAEQIVLVTGGTHLPRAVRCFEAQGFAVIPSGATYQAMEFNWSLLSFLPRAAAVIDVHVAFHEWMGMVLYWATGKFAT